MKTRQTPRSSVADYLEKIRLRHILGAISYLHLGDSAGYSLFEGDARAGRYVNRGGQGDHHLFAWSPEGLVGMEFDHDDLASQFSVELEKRTPEKLFAGAPGSLASLVRDLTGWDLGERLGTSSLWITSAEGAHGETLGSEGEGRALRSYGGSVREALSGGEPGGWLELHSLSAKHGKLAAALAKVGGGPTVLSEAQVAVVLAPPPRQRSIPQPEDVARAAEMLTQVGVAWPDAVAQAARRAEEVQRKRRADDHDHGLALLEAADRGDLEVLRELLAMGANLEKRSREGQLKDAYVNRETPLMVAVRRRHEAVARALIERGADINATTGVGITPLYYAVTTGQVTLVRFLLENGADAMTQPPGMLLAKAASKQDADLLRIVMDAGVLLPDRASCEWLARMAEELGAPDLAQRILAAG